MPTRLMLIRDSAPMPGARVKIKGLEGDFRSDDDGMVEVPVESETFSVAVHDTEDWVVKKIRRSNTKSMIVVDLSQRDQRKPRWNLSERYSFQQVLGRGGMGVVVRATDNVLKRPVAIKMLSEEFLENEEAQALFMTEGRAMAKLSHPNLVTVHDVTRADGRVLMVLEFVDGQNVESLLNRRTVLNTAEALSITIQVLKALEYLHSQNVIHRDLKPGNFMVNEAGTVKVIDFGLARSLEDLWNKGTRVRGTPAYMAPEQILGEQMSPATDIYQVAVSLWELVTGELPYSGEQLYAHVHEKVPRLRDFDQTLDPELDDILWSCLQKDPNQRPQSTAALRARLESIYHRVATDPDLETAATAHIVESGLSKNGRQTKALMPDTPDDLGTHPSGSDLVEPKPDDTPAEPGARRWAIPAVMVLCVLLLAGGVGGYASGLFGQEESTVSGTAAAIPVQSPEVDVEEGTNVEPEPATSTEVDTAIASAQMTIDSSVVRGEGEVSEPEESPAESARPRRRNAPGKDPAPESAPEPAEQAEVAVEETPAKAPTETDEPKVFEPAPFKPVAAPKAKPEKESAKAEEPEKAEPKPKPAKKEKETKTEVPVSF